MKIDILTFEKLLAIISDEIIIITESAGTYCELGAFVLNDDFMKKQLLLMKMLKNIETHLLRKVLLPN